MPDVRIEAKGVELLIAEVSKAVHPDSEISGMLAFVLGQLVNAAGIGPKKTEHRWGQLQFCCPGCRHRQPIRSDITELLIDQDVGRCLKCRCVLTHENIILATHFHDTLVSHSHDSDWVDERLHSITRISEGEPDGLRTAIDEAVKLDVGEVATSPRVGPDPET